MRERKAGKPHARTQVEEEREKMRESKRRVEQKRNRNKKTEGRE